MSEHRCANCGALIDEISLVTRMSEAFDLIQIIIQSRMVRYPSPKHELLESQIQQEVERYAA